MNSFTVMGTRGIEHLILREVGVDGLPGRVAQERIVLELVRRRGHELQPGPHPIQGIGAGFIPDNLHTQSIDGAIQVDPADAKEWARKSASEEGILIGISSGATLAAIAQKVKDLPAGTRVLGFNYDTGERYLSVPDFLPEE